MTADEKEALLVQIFNNMGALKTQIRDLRRTLGVREEEYSILYDDVQEKKKVYNSNLKIICGIDRSCERYKIMLRPLEIRSTLTERKARATDNRVGGDLESVRLYQDTARTLEEDLEVAEAEALEIENIINEENREYTDALEALGQIKNDINYLKSEISSREKLVNKLDKDRKKIENAKIEQPKVFRLVK